MKVRIKVYLDNICKMNLAEYYYKSFVLKTPTLALVCSISIPTHYEGKMLLKP